MILPNGASSISSHGRIAKISPETTTGKMNKKTKEMFIEQKLIGLSLRAREKMARTKKTTRTIAVSDSYPTIVHYKAEAMGKMCCGNCSVGENFLAKFEGYPAIIGIIIGIGFIERT